MGLIRGPREPRGPREKSLKQAEGAATRQGGRSEGPNLVNGGWSPIESTPLSYGEWQGGRKLEMPIFTRENPDGWIFRAEHYFNINRLSRTNGWQQPGWVLTGTRCLGFSGLRFELPSRVGMTSSNGCCWDFGHPKKVHFTRSFWQLGRWGRRRVSTDLWATIGSLERLTHRGLGEHFYQRAETRG